MEYVFTHNRLTVEEYQQLRATTDWNSIDDELVTKGINQNLFSVKVYDDNQLIGMGRIIGDGAIYFYIQDVIVTPDYWGKGVGKAIMNHIESFLQNNAPKNAFIGLMAAQGVEKFYQSLGYTRREDNTPGMFKYLDINNTQY